jgi:hypothetical protein
VPSLDDLVAWSTFLAFWTKYFSHLIIRRPNADICPDCYIAVNAIKFGTHGGNEDNDDNSNEDDEDDDDAFPGRDIFRQAEREDQIIKAGEHVRLAKRMRELFNTYITIARDHALTNIAHVLRTYMRIRDYCQKIENPYFGAEQPADIYYMSAVVTVNCFGLVDPTGTSSVNMHNLREYRHLLKAYVYNESVAGCGGNNVASLLIKDLHDSGLMDRTKGPGGHLVAAFDNCLGKNRNNHVLKTLCAWLVEKECF